MSKILCYQKHGGTCRQPVAEPNYACRYPGHNSGQAHLHGQAGGSLRTKQAKTQYGEGAAKAGFKGEQAASRYLWEIFKDDPAVHIFQDVDIPGGHGANADFVVIKGRSVLIVDAKMWGGGFYWSSFWRSNPLPHKGLTTKLFDSAVSTNQNNQPYTTKTVSMAKDIYEKQLAQLGGGPWTVRTAYLFIPPGSRSDSWKNINVRALYLHGAKKIVAGSPKAIPTLRRLLDRKADDNEAAIQMLQSLTRS